VSFDHRYMWSTCFVRDRLRTDRLSEAASFGYFLVIMAFDWLQFTFIATTPRPSISLWTLANSWTTFAVTVGGLLYLYIKNGGGAGQHFLRRYFPLSVTVGWKFVGAMFGTLWLIPVVLGGQSQEALGWSSTVAIAAVNVIMFWRIGFHLGSLAHETAV
jgi:hypothetical protein